MIKIVIADDHDIVVEGLISLIKPEILLINVNIADCVKPLMKKECLSFIYYLKAWSFDLPGLILLEYDKYRF